MWVSLPFPKKHLFLVAFLLPWLILGACARETTVPSPSPTTAATPSPPATRTPASPTTAPTITSTPTSVESIPTPTTEPLITYTPWELVHDLDWSPDGSRLAVSAGDWVHIYNAATLDELAGFYVGAWAVDLEYPAGDLLALVGKDGSLQFWDPRAGDLICRVHAHDKGANSLDISADGGVLASAGNDAILRLWDLAPLSSYGSTCSLQVQAEMIGGAFAVPAVRFSPDGTLIASIDLQVVRLRDLLTQRLVNTLRADNSLFDIAISPDGLWLATAELGNQVRLWELSTGEALHTLAHNEDPRLFIWRVTFSANGEILAAGSSDGTITLWDANGGDLLHAIPAHARAVTALAFSLDGNWLASGSLDASVRLWEMASIMTIPTP